MVDPGEVRTGEVADVDQVKAISNPTRLRILQVAREPVSARDMADQLEVPITRLYYHLDLLVGAGFLEVADVRKSGAQLERLYRRTADRFDPTTVFVDEMRTRPGGLALLASVIAEPVRLEVESVIAAGPGSLGDATRALVHMTPDTAAEYIDRIGALFDEFTERSERESGEGAMYFALTHVLAPLDPLDSP